MDTVLKVQIKQMIYTAISNYFRGRKVKTFHILDYLFPAERRIRSLIGGLEGSLGTTLWEPLAKVLAENNKFEIVKEKLLQPEPFPLQPVMAKLVHMREKGKPKITTEECITILRNEAKKNYRKDVKYINAPRGLGVDVYLKKNGLEYIFDIKTNQVNQGDGLKLNTQLLKWYAYRLTKDPDSQIEARIAFPFNPYDKDWWDRNGSRAYPLEKGVDAWVEDEFWDFLSGLEGTWSHIVAIFQELSREGFAEQFHNIFAQT